MWNCPNLKLWVVGLGLTTESTSCSLPKDLYDWLCLSLSFLDLLLFKESGDIISEVFELLLICFSDKTSDTLAKSLKSGSYLFEKSLDLVVTLGDNNLIFVTAATGFILI